jgi:hypothetical protein
MNYSITWIGEKSVGRIPHMGDATSWEIRDAMDIRGESLSIHQLDA